uniref:Uncharacterized protein n=1 Tax=Alexandrium monilatum TaxID=311494 RepID=A0A7S4WID2_9DINO
MDGVNMAFAGWRSDLGLWRLVMEEEGGCKSILHVRRGLRKGLPLDAVIAKKDMSKWDIEQNWFDMESMLVNRTLGLSQILWAYFGFGSAVPEERSQAAGQGLGASCC